MTTEPDYILLSAVLRELAPQRYLHPVQIQRALQAGRLELPGLVRVGRSLALPAADVPAAREALLRLDTCPRKPRRARPSNTPTT